LPDDGLHRTVAGAPATQPNLAGFGIWLAGLLGHCPLDALNQALERFGRAEGGFVGARAQAQVDTHQHRAVHDRDPLFARRLVTVEVNHQVEVTAASKALALGHD
jgi:hypothetical protein